MVADVGGEGHALAYLFATSVWSYLIHRIRLFRGNAGLTLSPMCLVPFTRGVISGGVNVPLCRLRAKD